MSDPDPRETAAEFFRQAYEFQVNGDYQQAIEFYSRSITAYPTAEAYTFRGWRIPSWVTTNAPLRNALRQSNSIRSSAILTTISGLT